MITDEEVFRALADATRRQILVLLRRQEYPVREIAERFPMSRPAISKHLRLLREAGLASERRQGRERLYGLEVEALEAVDDWLRAVREGAEPGEPPAAPARRAPSKPGRPGAPKPRRDRPPKPQPKPKPKPKPEPELEEDDWRAW